MALARFRILIRGLLNTYPDIVPEEEFLNILGINSAVCMDKNVEDTKHTRHISRRIYFVRNGEKCNLHKIYWC